MRTHILHTSTVRPLGQDQRSNRTDTSLDGLLRRTVAPLPPCRDMRGHRRPMEGRTGTRRTESSAGVLRTAQKAVQGRPMPPPARRKGSCADMRSRARTRIRPAVRPATGRLTEATCHPLPPTPPQGGGRSREPAKKDSQLQAGFLRAASSEAAHRHVRGRRPRHRRTAMSRTHVCACVRFCRNRTSTHMCAALWRHMYIWGDQDT